MQKQISLILLVLLLFSFFSCVSEQQKAEEIFSDQNDQAIKYFLYAESYIPIKQELYNNTGVAYFNLRDYKNALDFFHKAFLKDPNSEKAIENYNQTSAVFLTKENETTVLLPFEGEATVNLSCGWFYYYLGFYSDAVFYFNKVIENAPDYVMGYLSLGITYDTINNSSKAIESYLAALEIDGEYPDIWNNLGITFFNIGDISNSKFCFDTAIELNPDYPNPYNNLGFLLLETESGEAENFFNKAIELSDSVQLTGESFAGLVIIFAYKNEFKLAEGYKKLVVDYNYQLENSNYLSIEFGWKQEWVDAFLGIGLL